MNTAARQKTEVKKTRKGSGHRSDERPAVLETLFQEHRYMASLLRVVEGQLDQIEAGETLDCHVVYEAVHYLTQYPDRFHHPREDLVYAKAAEVSSVLQDDVDTLQHEHDALGLAGKHLLTTLSEAQRGAKSIAALVSPAREYIQTLYRHMEVEEALVFPKIEQALSAYDWELLAREELLEPVPDPLFGPVIAREYQKVARSMRRSLREGAENLLFEEWLGVGGVLEAIDVVMLGWDNTRGLVKDHLARANEENGAILRDSSADVTGLILAPARCAFANTRNYLGFLGNLVTLSKDVVSDIGEVRRDFKDRRRLLKEAKKTGSDPERTVH